MCCTLLWYTAGVPQISGAKTDPLRPLPVMQTQRALLARWVIPAHTSHLATTRSTQHPPDRLIRHAIITCDVTERFPLLDTLEHGCPRGGWDLPARISLSLRVIRQRHQQRVVKGRDERVFSR